MNFSKMMVVAGYEKSWLIIQNVHYNEQILMQVLVTLLSDRFQQLSQLSLGCSDF